MVIRGKPRGNGKQLAAYLLAAGENEAVHVFDIRGTSQPNDLRKSLLEMDLTSELTRSDKGLYHAQINPAYGEDKAMCREDWLRSADILEMELKLAGQKRVIVLHEKNGRTHAHVVWERYDHDKKRMVSDSYSRLAQDRARKTMEREFVQHHTPHRNKHRPVMKEELTKLWQDTKDGQEFIIKATGAGYAIAIGTQRPYMVIDSEGVSFDLVRQLDKVKTKEVRDRLQSVKLPTDKEAMKEVRTAQSRKSFLKAQEDAADKIIQHQEKVAAKKQEQELFTATIDKMKGMGAIMTQNAVDKNINAAQDKMNDMVSQFQRRQEADKAKADAETERQRLKQHFKEQIGQALNNPQQHGRGLSL